VGIDFSAAPMDVTANNAERMLAKTQNAFRANDFMKKLLLRLAGTNKPAKII
jgi:hypothetical protein